LAWVSEVADFLFENEDSGIIFQNYCLYIMGFGAVYQDFRWGLIGNEIGSVTTLLLCKEPAVGSVSLAS
jgi:hypothetical protein